MDKAVGGGTFIGGIWLVIGGGWLTKVGGGAWIPEQGTVFCIKGGGQLIFIGGAIPIPGGGSTGCAIREGIVLETVTGGGGTPTGVTGTWLWIGTVKEIAVDTEIFPGFWLRVIRFCVVCGRGGGGGGGANDCTVNCCIDCGGGIVCTKILCGGGGGTFCTAIFWGCGGSVCGGGGMEVGGIIFGGGKHVGTGGPTVTSPFGGGGIDIFTVTVGSGSVGGGTDLLGGGIFLRKSGFDIFFSIEFSFGVGILRISKGLGFGISFNCIGDGGGIFCTWIGAGGGIVKVFIGSGCGMLCTWIGFGGGIDANSIEGTQGGGTPITLPVTVVSCKTVAFWLGKAVGGGRVTVVNTVVGVIIFPTFCVADNRGVVVETTIGAVIEFCTSWGGGIFNNTGGATITDSLVCGVGYTTPGGGIIFFNNGWPVTFCGLIGSKLGCDIRLL